MCGLESRLLVGLNFNAVVVIWLILIIIISIFLTFLALILVSASSVSGSGCMYVSQATINCSSDQGFRQFPGAAHALPQVGAAILCDRGRAAARDCTGKAASAVSPTRRSSVTFMGVNCIYRSGVHC